MLKKYNYAKWGIKRCKEQYVILFIFISPVSSFTPSILRASGFQLSDRHLFLIIFEDGWKKFEIWFSGDQHVHMRQQNLESWS